MRCWPPWAPFQCEEGQELAFGDTPAYSISKAALNALTRIMHTEETDEHVGILAVCPGDVDTRMCMLPSGSDILTPEIAAKDVLYVAMNPEQFSSGRFYRARQEIDWWISTEVNHPAVVLVQTSFKCLISFCKVTLTLSALRRRTLGFRNTDFFQQVHRRSKQEFEVQFLLLSWFHSLQAMYTGHF